MRKILYIIVALFIVATVSFYSYKPAGAALMKIIYPVIIDRGLVGYWTMNGTDIDWGTGVVSDKSGSGNNGQLLKMSTTTSPVLGMVGQGLKLDGVNDYLTLGTVSTYDFTGADNFSIFAWTYLGATCDSVDSTICSVFDKFANSGYRFLEDLANKRMILSVRDAASTLNNVASTNGVLTKNAWNYVGVTSASGTVAFYVNGASAGTGSFTIGMVSNTIAANIGFAQNNNRYHQGIMDEVRIYNRALNAAEVQYLYQRSAPATANKISSDQNDLLPNGLVGFWSFNGPDIDWSGSGTIRNVVSGVTSSLSGFSKLSGPVLGVVGQGLLFQGTSQNSISVSNSSNQIIPASNAAFSIALWFKPKSNFSSSNVGRGLIGNETFGVSGFRWALINSGGGKSQFWSSQDGGSILMTSSNAIATSTWNHAVISYTGSSAAMYLNGSLNAEDTSGIIVSNTNNILISDNLSSSNFFDGIMDEIRIYNRALSAAEVQYLYQRSAPATANKISSDQNSEQTNGLVGLWSFNGPDIDWSTGVVSDKSGSGNNGQLIGMSTTTSPVMGVVGQGLGFDGVSSYITASSTTNQLNITGDLSIAFWIRRTGNLTTYDGVIEKRTSGIGAPYAVIGHGNTQLRFIFNDSNAVWQTGIIPSTIFKMGQWYHVVFLKDSVNLKEYAFINGVSDATPVDITNGIGTTNNHNLRIGFGASVADAYLEANLDEVRVYNRILSAAEIYQLYQNSKR